MTKTSIPYRSKRWCDLLVIIALSPLLLPLCIFIAAIVKLTSKGPIFYSHERMGLNGEKFRLYKFRTMCIDADAKLKSLLTNDPSLQEEWLRHQKLKNDPRLTAIGPFLRKSSLDELPQLFNALKGDMSLVGPRPYLQNDFESMPSAHQNELVKARPGLTGLWQISGRNLLTLEERMKLDELYIQQCNLWQDLAILFKTLPALINPKGAF